MATGSWPNEKCPYFVCVTLLYPAPLIPLIESFPDGKPARAAISRPPNQGSVVLIGETPTPNHQIRSPVPVSRLNPGAPCYLHAHQDKDTHWIEWKGGNERLGRIRASEVSVVTWWWCMVGARQPRTCPLREGPWRAKLGVKLGRCAQRGNWGCREVILGAETVSAHGRESETMLIRSPHHLSYFTFHPPIQSWNIGLN